ncbi:MAG: 16S rRNA (cytosine(967)-C(5))-methyltransferase RsmB [Firmicutes bacterium]|nr:16S rRNA (cytosine(967)-C(5))-methyltransferase RsmB [Bacillota bacterium]
MTFSKRNSSKDSSQQGEVGAREAALLILKEVEEKGAYLNLVLNRVLAQRSFTPAERALLTELAHGVIQRLQTLDWVISLYSTRPLKKFTPWIRNILRIGTYQLLYLERIPEAAAVDEAVKLGHRYGHKGVAGLVNAVLRKIGREKNKLPWPSREQDPARYLSLFYAYPLWMARRWIENLGLEAAEAHCSAGNQRPPLTIRTNTLRLSRDELQKVLEEEGAGTQECRYTSVGLYLNLAGRLAELESFQRGLFQVQGESSMLAATLLNPQPGELVLDLCSAPGGKTTHLAALMKNQGRIIAADLYPHRLKLVQAACARQGVQIVEAENIDGRSLPPQWQGLFRRVLLDVPCSGLGVIRRKGDLKWRRRPEDIASLSQLQQQLLRSAFQALSSGGVLLYSACTTEPEETTEIIDGFLAEEPLARPAPLSPFLPPALSVDEKTEGQIFLWPTKHDLDGFFLARIRKR